MSELQFKKAHANGVTTISLIGRMSETAQYAALADVGGADCVEFDFDGVTLINSKGIQIWKTFMTSLPQDLVIRYVNCTLKIVNQLNLFPSFQGNKKVEIKTFYAPYFCEACDSQLQIRLETAAAFPDPRTAAAPSVTCPSCAKPMEFDANPQKYFMFLRRSA